MLEICKDINDSVVYVYRARHAFYVTSRYDLLHLFGQEHRPSEDLYTDSCNGFLSLIYCTIWKGVDERLQRPSCRIVDVARDAASDRLVRSIPGLCKREFQVTVFQCLMPPLRSWLMWTQWSCDVRSCENF